MAQNDRSLRSGVTLIETVMVIVVLATAATASLFYLDGRWLARRHVANATNDVAETLISAKNTAVINQAVVRVRRFRSGSDQKLLIIEDAGPHRSRKTWTVDLGPDVRVFGRPRTIRFQPSGTANRRLAWTIRDSRVRGRVTVNPVTGVVRRSVP